jgi:hypothetical protein
MPLLFAAGMTLIDTVTEAVMREAYRWALQNPVPHLGGRRERLEEAHPPKERT